MTSSSVKLDNSNAKTKKNDSVTFSNIAGTVLLMHNVLQHLPGLINARLKWEARLTLTSA